jgi:hypothetical protein
VEAKETGVSEAAGGEGRRREGAGACKPCGATEGPRHRGYASHATLLRGDTMRFDQEKVHRWYSGTRRAPGRETPSLWLSSSCASAREPWAPHEVPTRDGQHSSASLPVVAWRHTASSGCAAQRMVETWPTSPSESARFVGATPVHRLAQATEGCTRVRCVKA